MSSKIKLSVITILWISIILSVVFIAETLLIRIILTVVLIGVTVHIILIRSRTRNEEK